MGIGYGQARLLTHLAGAGLWREIRSVCELGAQEPRADELDALFDACGKASLPGRYGAAALYRHLGVERYVAIDTSGEEGALVLDLNQPLPPDVAAGQFDLVTNFGTTEHCFNQFEAFRNVHRLCRPGGWMLHTLPAQGWGGHCLYRYDANFFVDLAAANGYELVLLEPFLRLRRYLRRDPSETTAQVRSLCALIDSRREAVQPPAAEVPEDPAARAALSAVATGSALFNITLACILRKGADCEFTTPMQGRYRRS